MKNTVIGLFDSREEARAAMNELVQNGFMQEDIDFSEGVAGNTAADTTNTTASSDASNNESFGDSVSNFFNNLFGDDETTARNYSTVASESEGILTVQVDSAERAKQVAQIFDRNGAIDVDERASQSQNFSQSSSGAAQTRTETATAATDSETIPVIEENLQVGKRTVESGGVRVRSRIIEKPVEETVRLRQERVVVNRRPVNRAVTDADLTNFREGEIEITEHAEEAVVGKQARVVEEVAVGKQVEEHDQVIRDTVRRTDVEVEEIDADNAARSADNRS